MNAYDLGDIAQAMESNDTDAYLNPATGSVYIGYGGDVFGDDGHPLDEVPDEWIPIGHASSHEAYRDMEDFAWQLREGARRRRLLTALEGRGAFRRFRDAVHSDDSGLGRLWGQWSDIRGQIRAAEWLADEDLITDDECDSRAAELRVQLGAIAEEVDRADDAELLLIEAMERELQTPVCRRDTRRLAELLDESFEEVGASGRRWTRDEIARLLTEEPPASPAIEVLDLRSRYVTDDVVIVQWRSVREAQSALRTSLWRKDAGTWRLVHHQGTPTH